MPHVLPTGNSELGGRGARGVPLLFPRFNSPRKKPLAG